MGKPTGFLEYERKTSETIPPKERIKNFQEFHIPLSEAEQRKQGASFHLRNVFRILTNSISL